MDSLLAKALDEHTPQMNHRFVRGIVKDVFKAIPKYLDRMIRISMAKVDPSIDFKYVGIRFVLQKKSLWKILYLKLVIDLRI